MSAETALALAASNDWSAAQVAHLAQWNNAEPKREERLREESAMIGRLSPKARKVALAMLRHGRAL